MGRPKRHSRRLATGSPEALAAHLPLELRSSEDLASVDAYKARTAAVAEWLETHITDSGWQLLLSGESPVHRRRVPSALTAAVMAAAGIGLTVADYYRYRMTGHLGTR